MTLEEQLAAFIPFNEQEERDRALILHCLKTEKDVFTRQNRLAHMTASAWIVNADRTKALMAYHNLYHSWSWLGGHADGERNLRGLRGKRPGTRAPGFADHFQRGSPYGGRP